MIKNALEYLVGLRETKTYQIDGHTYSNEPLKRIDPPKNSPSDYNVGSLDALVKMIYREYDRVCTKTKPLFVRVVSPTRVTVDTSWGEDFSRASCYTANVSDQNFNSGRWNLENAIILLQSMFLPTGDRDYLLDLLSRVTIENGATTEDNGMSQTVTVRQGVALKTTETVRSILSLKPFRTFREVSQPESLFLIRLDSGTVNFVEADGGVWRMEAKDSIAAYLEQELCDLVSEGYIEVLRG